MTTSRSTSSSPITTRFGVVQAITYVAHAANRDPDVRFAMERFAGDYLAATPILAEA